MANPADSGSFLYLTEDGRFVVKSVNAAELATLLAHLADYHQHLVEVASGAAGHHPHPSLLAAMLAAFTVHVGSYGQEIIYF